MSASEQGDLARIQVRDEEAYEWRLREEVVAWQQLVDHERTAHLHAIAAQDTPLTVNWKGPLHEDDEPSVDPVYLVKKATDWFLKNALKKMEMCVHDVDVHGERELATRLDRATADAMCALQRAPQEIRDEIDLVEAELIGLRRWFLRNQRPLPVVENAAVL